VVIEKFQLPFNGGGVSDGNQIFFRSPSHTSRLSIGDQKNWSPLNSGGVSNGDWIFFGYYLTHPRLRMVTKNFQSPHLLSVEKKFGRHKVQWLNCFLVAIGYDNWKFSSCYRVYDDQYGSNFGHP
jgi:hypothetical protein